MLQKTPYSFDVSVWEFFWPLMFGAHLVVARPEGHKDPDYLVRTIIEQGVTTLHFVPSMLQIFLEHPEVETCRCLKRVFCSGEALGYDLQKKFFSRLSAELYNLYGPTEAAVDVSWWACRPDSPLPFVPIGRPVANTQLYILNDSLDPFPPGVEGELYIGGVQVARGYIGRPELTAERFIPDPFSHDPAGRLYKTGDICRWLDDGNIEYLGRADDQIKLRGFRIELGEIESVLRNHPSVRQAVVMAREDEAGQKVLVGYVVPKIPENFNEEELRNYLALKLPEYMVPSLFVEIETVPVTASGKTNRKALPKPHKIRMGCSGGTVPQTEIQQALAEIWKEILGIPSVHLEDHFFRLGGHSLKAIQVIYRVQSYFDLQIPVSCLFDHPTLERFSEAVESLRSQDQNRAVQIPRIARDKPIPQSYAQQRLWFIESLLRNIPLYCVSFRIDLRGPLNYQILENSIRKILDRHEAFRTMFSVIDGKPVQIIHSGVEWNLPVSDFSNRVGTSAEEYIAVAQREAGTIFNLQTGPLFHFHLLKAGEDHHILLLNMHHLITDGWSIGIFIRELQDQYVSLLLGTEIQAVALPIQAADYGCWQRNQIDYLISQSMNYWKHQLPEDPPSCTLPEDYPRPNEQTYAGNWFYYRISSNLYLRLKDMASRHHVTLNIFLLASFACVLHRLTGMADILIGSPISGRTRHDLENIIGFFVNTIVLRFRTHPGETFNEYLQETLQRSKEAHRHQELPFGVIVESLKPRRDPCKNIYFQIMFAYQDARYWSLSLPGIKSRVQESHTTVSNFDMTLFAEENDEGLLLRAEYNTDLYKEETIRRFLRLYEHVLESIVADPSQRIDQINLLTSEDAVAIRQWNKNERAYPRDRRINQIYEDQVAKTPDAVALEFEGQMLTFAELNAQANQLAHYLCQKGVGRNIPVGLCMDRSLEMMVALLAILKAGGGYVPLDPLYPAERLRLMAKEAGVTLILADAGLQGIFPESIQRINPADTAIYESYPETNPSWEGTSEDLAYIVFTSGSTGTPKGVAVPHRGVVRLVFGQDYMEFGPELCMLQLAPVSFDASTLEIWGPLLHGGRCVLYPGRIPELEQLEGVLQRKKITALWLTASLFNMVIDTRPLMLANVATVLTGGEALSVPHVRKALEVLPNVQLVNGYGPTESTTFTCCYRIPKSLPERLSSIPIGRPIANTQVYILDSHLQPVPIGVSGELYIGGDGLARGYVNRPELTAERFVRDPFSEDSSRRLYKTGDMCRWLGDGTIEFLGRMDDQVKIRGFRIELGEIESALRSHPLVQQAVVTAREDEPGQKVLVGYVVQKEKERYNEKDLQEYLATKLPEYMIPSTIVELDTIPLTASGKADRKQLPRPRMSKISGKDLLPQTDTEIQLAEIWKRLLKREVVYRDDHFFRLGGHSLLAAELFFRIQDRFSIHLPIPTIFEAPTLGQLAAAIDRATTEMTTRDLVQIKSGSGAHPIFYLPGIGGHTLSFYHLAEAMQINCPQYGLNLRGLDGKSEPQESIEEMATYFVELVRSVQPQGPYNLCGFSFGGRVAFEMALQLQSAGEPIGFLGMLGATAPGYPPMPENPLLRIGYRLVDFGRIGPARQWRYLRFKIRKILSRVRREIRGKGRNGTTTVHMEMPYQQSVVKAAMKAWYQYKPVRKLAGDLTVIREGQSLSDLYARYIDPEYGWGRYVEGNIRVHQLDCGHMDLFRPPFVEELGRVMEQCLRESIEKE
ncbi:MAG: amino acid adenylation domain-containing protein [Phycisphaerae bacterium]|nr:amino acid adenylation domain-containing protein [Phycisphaerae bacterium]